jgi:hypothetical protein
MDYFISNLKMDIPGFEFGGWRLFAAETMNHG